MAHRYKWLTLSLTLLATVAACSEKTAENSAPQTGNTGQAEQKMPAGQQEQTKKSGTTVGQTIKTKMYHINTEGLGQPAGMVRIKETPYGTLFIPQLENLSPGIHGFHIHENPDCGPGEKNGEVQPGLAAGGHYDPQNTGRHEGPYGNGHLGDLPPLYVTADGTASTPVLAPRVELKDVKGRSLMVHAGGDNFSDTPEKDGGGGKRVVCGVVDSEHTGAQSELSPPQTLTPAQPITPVQTRFLPWHYRTLVL